MTATAVARLPRRTAAAAVSGVRAREIALAIGLVGAAFLLRAYAAQRSLWLDETISVFQVERPLRDVLQTQVDGFHPPLFHVTLHFWIAWFGDSAFAVRSLAMVWSLVSLLALTAWSREAFPRRSPVPTAFLVALGPFAVWYGSEARMYAQLLALTAVAGWLAWRVLGGDTRARTLLGLGAAAAALLYTHYFATLFFAALGLVALVLVVRGGEQRRGAIAVLVCLCVAVAAFSPWGLYVVTHRHANGIGPEYPEPDLFSVLIAGLEMLVGFHSPAFMGVLAAGWPALCMLGFALLPRMRRVPWRVSGLIVLIVLPPALLVAASLVARNVFDPRYLTVAVAPLYVFGGALWDMVRPPRLRAIAGALLAVAASAASVAQVHAAGNPKLYQISEAFQDAARDGSPDDVLLIVPDFERPPLIHYYGAPAGMRVVAATSPAQTWKRVMALHPRHVVMISSFEGDPLAAGAAVPAAFRGYIAARSALVRKGRHIQETVRVYRPLDPSR